SLSLPPSLLKNVLYSQAGLGVLANLFLLFFYTFIILVHKSKLMDLISCQLTLIHTFLVLTGGDIGLIDIFESLNIDNDFECKATVYINRMMKGLSICIICLLSVFQAVTISPSASLLAKFKHKLKKYTIHGFFYIWFLNLLFNSNQIFYVGAFSNFYIFHISTCIYSIYSHILYIMHSLCACIAPRGLALGSY
ncbi:putative vomeronasal receptor-like protein 4, partial [Phodopus roborovskii]|uniref:putative vomeronasal receptor-like protein 4 n=1 Tax=Phodopus roborovskii TaxID=109678 RepID=UPI0021E482A2